MLDTHFANLEPLNFSRFEYEPLAFKCTASSFVGLPESAKSYLSSPCLKGRLLSSVRDDRVEELFKSIQNIQVAIVGGLLQIHLPEQPLEKPWLEDLEKVVYQNLKQEYVTILDGFVEDFDALFWEGMKQEERRTGKVFSEEEMKEKRIAELNPILVEVYKRLLKTWSQGCGERFAGADEW